MSTMRLALVGKTGHGKSATGNTILRKDLFQPGNYQIDCTEVVVVNYNYIDSVYVKVYDTPGVMRTNHSEKEGAKKTAKDMDYLISASGGIDVFIIVYSFSARFTSEESKSIEQLGILFGKRFLEKHGIIVVTHGDDFEIHHPGSNNLTRDFEKWCENHSEGFKNLIDKVNNRIILVNNVAAQKDRNKAIEYSEKILTMARDLIATNGSYLQSDYEGLKRWRWLHCTIL